MQLSAGPRVRGSQPTTFPGCRKRRPNTSSVPRAFRSSPRSTRSSRTSAARRCPGVHSGTNSAGAAGPGQFLFSTWATYGVDANGDGRKDIYSIPDSVFATANYLHASGAPGDWRAAIFAYNHAEWYVEEVLRNRRQLRRRDARSLHRRRRQSRRNAGRSLAGSNTSPSGSNPSASTTAGAAATGRSPAPRPAAVNSAGRASEGLDCSGAVRWLLVLSGYPDPGGLVSNELGAHYPAGRGPT